jgi:hypothetical protein
MAYLLTPARARIKEDVDIRAKILDEYLKDKHPVGFEVVLKGGPKGDLMFQDAICKNLDSFSSNSDFYIAVHTPLEREDYTKKHTDLTTEQGLETFARVLQLAKRINAGLVNTHSENFHLGKDLLQKDISPEEKRELQDRVKKSILQAKTSVGYDGIITLENMPYPLMGDIKDVQNIEDVPYDPIIDSAEDILYFSNAVGICIDTCHYGIAQRIINEISGLPQHELRKRGVLGIPYEDIKPQPKLVELAGKLGESLKHVHLSDFRGIWVPGESFYEEGLVPGEGEYGSELKEFLKFISGKEVPVNLEVYDSDLSSAPETKKTIAYVLDILS